MTSRQARRERREAERKIKKAEFKRLKAEQSADAPAALVPESVPQNAPSLRPVPQNDTKRSEINRQNAQHSTGPTTAAGKLASSRNSLKHGLSSGELIIPGEDPAAFDRLLNVLLEEHRPANETEELLVKEIAQSFWLEQRAIRFQNECFTPQGVDESRLSLFLRYQTTHNRAFHKALNTLSRLKQNRAREQAAAVSGFVPQRAARPGNSNGFVSQNSNSVRQNHGSVSQNGQSAALAHRQKAA